MTDLSDFGGGVDRESETEAEDPDPSEDDESGRKDGAEISDQCRAVKDDGSRCENAITRMSTDPVCGPHDRAEDVELIDEGSE